MKRVTDMAKHSRVWNQGVFEKYVKEGRGQGDGPGYTPWIRIQDFASQGIVSRVKGLTTGRIHHLMSNNELAYFYLLDWSDAVIDIREQYPLLDLDCAISEAAKAGIKYPTDKTSGYPYVMTCDFMLTTTQGLKARTVKQSSELSNARTIEKLEIERRYWNHKRIEWKLVTEKDICHRKAKNIEWFYSGQNLNVFGISDNDFNYVFDSMKLLYTTTTLPILEIAHIIENEFSYPGGMGIALFKNLVLRKDIKMDMSGDLCLNRIRMEVA